MKWSDDVQDIMAGDLVTTFGYLTPAGGAVAIPVSPVGLVDRKAGSISLTTSLAFSGKLQRLLRDPRVAMAYDSRDHGFSVRPGFVLTQGDAAVSLTPSPERLAALAPATEKFLGATPSGPVWDWVLREYNEQRVVIDIAVSRTMFWPTADAAGSAIVDGQAWPHAAPKAQVAPKKGIAPRVDTAKTAKRAGKLKHQVVAYRGSDDRPVIVPITVTGHSRDGLHLQAAEGLLPSGGRRAGLTAHSFGPQAVGLANLVCTGWLEVSGRTAVYSPHTSAGFTAPPNKSIQLFVNGLMSKQRIRRAERDGTFAELAELAELQRHLLEK